MLMCIPVFMYVFRYVCMFSGLWPAAVISISCGPDLSPVSVSPNPHGNGRAGLPVHRASVRFHTVRTPSSSPSCAPGPPISFQPLQGASTLLPHLVSCVHLPCGPAALSLRPLARASPEHHTACGCFCTLDASIQCWVPRIPPCRLLILTLIL